MNPYTNTDIWEFFLTFISRLFLFITGKLSLSALAVDEIQILVLSGVAISSACVGTFLILRKMTMLANAMSHTILIGIIVAFILTSSSVNDADSLGKINIQAMLTAAVIMGIITTFLTQFLHRVINLQEDASIGLVFTGLFALGVVVATLWTRSIHLGTEAVMGNVDALHLDDLQLVFAVLVINFLLVALFFKEYKLTSFDPPLAKALGFSLVFFDYLLMVQVSITVVGAFRAVGVLMVLAFLTAPPLMARFVVDRLKPMVVLSCVYGVIAAVTGVAIARHLLSVQGIAVSTAGVVVCVLVLMFVGHVVYKIWKGRNCHKIEKLTG